MTATMQIGPALATKSCYALFQEFQVYTSARSAIAPSFGEDSIAEIESMLANAPVIDED